MGGSTRGRLARAVLPVDIFSNFTALEAVGRIWGSKGGANLHPSPANHEKSAFISLHTPLGWLCGSAKPIGDSGSGKADPGIQRVKTITPSQLQRRASCGGV